ncbi:mitochondrial uncoupling protein 5 isoform X3 [Lactuca sativa]|uniref:mitochondrial uncoupling protein 5 isoform X3 n=1 Tax=Lactuca sativa TaxID=4236 RepID=UPI0022AE8D35|nr:mitochondrial uncoupling protein 5 isoform X3 [Lactuca sativa]
MIPFPSNLLLFSPIPIFLIITSTQNPSTMGVKSFVEGGIASIIAGCSTHPLDLIKVRMQLQGENHATGRGGITRPPRVGPISVGMRIIRQDGFRALYSGVSATMLRQTLYSTTRMGLYDMLKTKWTDPNTGIIPLWQKITAGLIAGGIGAAVGNPADVAMVRMQADGRVPPAERRNYKSVFDAISRMVKNEGIGSLWRGSSLTVNRAMLVTASQLASYDQMKETILNRGWMKDGLGTHVTASFGAGFVAALMTNPVDVIKTRVMNMKVVAGKAPPYTGAVDCALKTIKAEGPMALYNGFIPTISRQGPFTIVLFVTLEQVPPQLGERSRRDSSMSHTHSPVSAFTSFTGICTLIF